MPTLTADNRLRMEVLKDPNIILIIEPGLSDKVIKVNPLPSCLDSFRKEQLHKRLNNSEFKELQHTEIDLSRGPEIEIWREIEREVFAKADRSKPIAKAVAVNNKLGEPWMISLEEVPEVNLIIETKTEVKPIENPVKVEGPKEEFRCACGKVCASLQGLKVHQSKCKVK